MKTQEIIAKELGFVSDEAFRFAMNRIKELGFIVKEEEERNEILLDRLSTYIDKYEFERWNEGEIAWESLERLEGGTEIV